MTRLLAAAVLIVLAALAPASAEVNEIKKTAAL